MKRILILGLFILSIFILGGCGLENKTIPPVNEVASQNAVEAYWSTTEIGVESFTVHDGGLVIIDLRNNMRDPVTIVSIGIEGIETDFTNFELSPGAKEIVELDIGKSICRELNYDFGIQINYINTETGEEKLFDGLGHKLKGNCI